MSAMPTPFMPGQPGNQFDLLSSLSGYGGSLGSGTYSQPAPAIAGLGGPGAGGFGGGYGAPSATPSFMKPGFIPGAPATPGGGGIMDWMFGKGTKDSPGNIGGVLGAASSLASGFMAMKQYGLAKDTLAQNKQMFDTQFAAKKGLTNASLEDRQRARVASNAGAYQSVGDYMSQNGVK